LIEKKTQAMETLKPKFIYL